MSEFEQIDEDRWRDCATGLVLVRPPSGRLYRVFQAKYSALNPRIPGEDRSSWGRFDVLDHVALYGADSPTGAFCETLAYAKPADLALDAIFSDVKPGENPVAREWAALGHMEPGHVPRSWRVNRALVAISLRSSRDWFVDVEHSETIGVLRSAASSWSTSAELTRDPTKIDVSLLTGARREATTAIASWLRSRVLADGSEPSGLRYCSRHGTDLICWTIWIPLHGETEQSAVPARVQKVINAGSPEEIPETSTALRAAASRLGLRVF